MAALLCRRPLALQGRSARGRPVARFAAEAAAGGSSKVHLNRFLLKVHPDRFHHAPAQERFNQDNLQKLNLILNEVRDFVVRGTYAGPSRSAIEFYVRSDEPSEQPPIKIRHVFELPESAFAGGSEARQRVSQLANEHLRALLQQAGVAMPVVIDAPPAAVVPGSSSTSQDVTNQWVSAQQVADSQEVRT
jgi:hypothetical protein